MGYEKNLFPKNLLPAEETKKLIEKMAIENGGKVNLKDHLLEGLEELDERREKLLEKLEKTKVENERRDILEEIELVDGFIKEYEKLDKRAQDMANELS